MPATMANNSYLAEQLQVVNRLHAARASKPDLMSRLAMLKAFERRRLYDSYADFSAQKGYVPAIDFMVEDIFVTDFSMRDAEMQRAYPAMVRLLPASILETVALAVELDICLIRFEDSMLPELPVAPAPLEERAYITAFYRGDCERYRLELIERVSTVGAGLDAVVHKPFIATTLKLCRTPARMAGLACLQDFLERGLHAFKVMPQPALFLQAFVRREKQIVDNIRMQRTKPFAIEEMQP